MKTPSRVVDLQECSHGHLLWRLGRCHIGHKANLPVRYVPESELKRLQDALERIRRDPTAAADIAERALDT